MFGCFVAACLAATLFSAEYICSLLRRKKSPAGLFLCCGRNEFESRHCLSIDYHIFRKHREWAHPEHSRWIII